MYLKVSVLSDQYFIEASKKLKLNVLLKENFKMAFMETKVRALKKAIISEY